MLYFQAAGYANRVKATADFTVTFAEEWKRSARNGNKNYY